METDNPVESSRNQGIQLLRAILCIGIVVAHSFAYAEMAYGLEVGKALNYWGRNAMLHFTDGFFAITGFFMARVILNCDENTSSLRFLKRRFSRIYPGYWTAIATAILLFLCFNGAYASNKNFWKIFFLVSPEAPYLLGGEWTLIYDVTFYLFTAVFLSSRRKKLFPVFLVLWTAGIWAGMMNSSVSYTDIVVQFPQRLFSIRNLAFVAGCLGQYIYRAAKKCDRMQKVLGSFSFLLLTLILFVANYEGLYLKTPWGRLLHNFILIFVVLSAVFNRPKSGSLYALLYRLGNCSYEIYLIHPTILRISFQLISGFGIEYRTLLNFCRFLWQ